jgi:hypothetical protein
MRSANGLKQNQLTRSQGSEDFRFLIFDIRRLLRTQISLEIGKKLCNEFHININDEER